MITVSISVYNKAFNESLFFLSNMKIMLSDNVVNLHQIVDLQVLLETIIVEQHIFVHQIYVMELVQKKYFLVKRVSDGIHK